MLKNVRLLETTPSPARSASLSLGTSPGTGEDN